MIGRQRLNEMASEVSYDFGHVILILSFIYGDDWHKPEIMTARLGWNLIEFCKPSGTKLQQQQQQQQQQTKTTTTPWPLVRERTIPTERPPLVDEI
jgi:hypothetical protein